MPGRYAAIIAIPRVGDIAGRQLSPTPFSAADAARAHCRRVIAEREFRKAQDTYIRRRLLSLLARRHRPPKFPRGGYLHFEMISPTLAIVTFPLSQALEPHAYMKASHC